MEQILINLNDPSWWFTGIFFILVGLLFTKFFIDWLPSLFEYISKIIPTVGLRFTRWTQFHTAKSIKKYRQEEIRVSWLIARYWYLATVSVISMILVFIVYLLYPKDGYLNNKIASFTLCLPAYLFYIRTIWEKKILKAVIRAHIEWKKNITKST